MIWCMILCDVMWCDLMWYDMIWCDVIWNDVMWYEKIWYDMIWCDVLWCDVMWCDMMWCDVIHDWLGPSTLIEDRGLELERPHNLRLRVLLWWQDDERQKYRPPVERLSPFHVPSWRAANNCTSGVRDGDEQKRRREVRRGTRVSTRWEGVSVQRKTMVRF